MTTPNNDLRTLAREFRLALEARLSDASMWEYRLPSKDEVAAFCRSYLDALFPLYFSKEEVKNPDAVGFLAQLDLQLAEQIVYAMRFDLNCCGKPVPANLSETAHGGASEKFLGTRGPAGHQRTIELGDKYSGGDGVYAYSVFGPLNR